MVAVKFQFSVRHLFAFTTLASLVIFGFVYHTLFALFVLAAAGGHFGRTLLARDGARLVAAAFGGATGGLVWLFLHLVIGYALHPGFEDSGVGFIGAMIGISPIAMVVGAIIGSLVWLVWLAVRTISRLIQIARRFRFSVRTLVIFVTLVCVYLGAWETTKRHGVPETWKWSRNATERSQPFEASSPMPFVVATKENVSTDRVRRKQRWYFWFFGYKALMRERDWNQGRFRTKPGFEKLYPRS